MSFDEQECKGVEVFDATGANVLAAFAANKTAADILARLRRDQLLPPPPPGLQWTTLQAAGARPILYDGNDAVPNSKVKIVAKPPLSAEAAAGARTAAGQTFWQSGEHSDTVIALSNSD